MLGAAEHGVPNWEVSSARQKSHRDKQQNSRLADGAIACDLRKIRLQLNMLNSLQVYG